MRTALLTCFLSVLLLRAEPLPSVPVWTDAPPGETLKLKPGADPKGVVPRPGSRTDVFAPEFTPWPAAKPGAPLIIVFPGGGYNGLAEAHEGVAVAQRLNALGCAALVVRYRVPRRDPQRPWIVPLLDARKVLEIARARAAEWNADPAKVGVLGFSAGGNLATRVAYAPAEAGTPRPDFAVLVYPAYLFEKDQPDSVLREGPDGVVPPAGTKKLPPAFFAHSANDPYPAEASMRLAARLKSLGGLTEVHVWAKGGHGWGATERCEAAKRWTDDLGVWLREIGVLVP